MDSPLNLGHQQGRQADRMMKAEKYEEAILCHRRAAEYMLEAMQLTSSPYALESLNIQHKHHIRQQELIRVRQNRIEAKEAASLKSPKTGHKSAVAADAHSREATPHSDKEQSLYDNTVSSPTLAPNEDLLYWTMNENDSLLYFLVNRTTSVKSQPTYTPEPNYKIVPKDDKVIIEELRIHTEDLRKHILLLLKESDECRLENQELHERLRQYESAEALYLDTDNMHLPCLELPPLEMPEFDFDSLTDKFSDSESCNQDTKFLTGK